MTEVTREAVARAIAEALGDDYDHAFANKAEWIVERGERGGRFRDVNEPFRCDYDEAARAALTTAHAEAAAMREEIARLKLDVEAKEALQVSAYRAGMKAGWNFCDANDFEGYLRAQEGTEHIAELRRIRAARAALSEQQP